MSYPTVPALPAASWIYDADAEPEVASPIVTMDEDYKRKINRHAAAIEAFGRSHGAWHVVEGLGLSMPGGLEVEVAQGMASIDGYVVVRAATAVVVPQSTAAIHLWLTQSVNGDGEGTVLVRTDTSPPPSVKALYLGQAATNATDVTSVGRHGVLVARGGGLWRTLPSAPADSPPAGCRVWTQVGTTVYLWDGTSHRTVVA